MAQHHATFTWGAGPGSVYIAGGFNAWSGDATPLHRQEDGTFRAEVPVPWGEKQAFKYIVDGEWKVREDEAKEWDAAGNMNNVYTAPAAPLMPQSAKKEDATAASAPAPAPIPVPAPIPALDASPESKSKNLAAPAPAPAPAPVPVPIAEPAATASAASQVPELGAPATLSNSSTSKSAAVVDVEKAQPQPQTAVGTAPQVVPVPVNPPATAPTKAEEIEKTAAAAPIGEAATQEHEEGFLERAAAAAAAAVAGLGAAAGTAAVAVERVTGVDFAHGSPISVEEARKQGINVDSIQQVDAPTDTTSPVGIPPSKTAVADLENKVNDLKVEDAGAPKTVSTSGTGTGVAAVPLPNGSAPQRSEAAIDRHDIHDIGAHNNDIPSQSEAAAAHSVVPAPVITDLTHKDPKKDRTMFGTSDIDTAATKPISSDPSVSAREAKHEAEANPNLNGSTEGAAKSAGPAHAFASSGTASTPVSGSAALGPLPAGETSAAPDRKSTNFDAPEPVKKDVKPAAEPPRTPPKSKTSANGAADNKPVTPAPASGAASVPPAPTPGSINSTPASTPQKAAHGREGTAGSDVRKRKSSFFHKIKSAFSPKDKEKAQK